MYLEKISGFVTFLANKDHTLQEILDHLNRVILRSLETSTVSLSQINDNNELSVAARSGVSKESALIMKSTYSRDDKYPNVDAIRSLSTIWIDTLPDWGEDYPLMKNYPLDPLVKTYFAVPIYVTGTPTAVLVVTCRIKISPNIEVDAFLKALGHILSMYMFRNVLSSPLENLNKTNSSNSSGSLSFRKENRANQVAELTDRQLVILRLISEERTNTSIAQFLGYSESTIRQEIMRIFAKLGCSHRSEAANLFRGFTSQ